MSWRTYLADRLASRIRPERRVLVTGGSGFIGTNLVELYTAGGARVLSLDVSPPADSTHEPLWRKADLLDRNALREVVAGFEPEVVHHLAARTDLDERAGDGGYAANVEGVENLLSVLADSAALERVVVTSSQLVCRPGYVPAHELDYAPHTAYGRSKVLTERIVREWDAGPTWVIARPTSIWGPWFGPPYRDFFITVRRHRFAMARGIDPVRSYGFVGNVAAQYVALADAPADRVAGRTFYLADLEPTRLREWAELIRNEFGVGPSWNVPLGLLKAGAVTGDIVRRLGIESFPLNSARLRNMLVDWVADMQPTEDLVERDPFGIGEGVRLTVAWMRDRGLV